MAIEFDKATEIQQRIVMEDLQRSDVLKKYAVKNGAPEECDIDTYRTITNPNTLMIVETKSGGVEEYTGIFKCLAGFENNWWCKLCPRNYDLTKQDIVINSRRLI